MIKVLDNITDQTTLAEIEAPHAADISEGLNQEFILTLSVELHESQPWQEIQVGRIIEAEDQRRLQWFEVARIEKHRESTGALYLIAECEHISYRLSEKEYEDSTFTGKTPAGILAEICSGTDIDAGASPAGGTKDFHFVATTARAALIQAAEAWGFEIDYGPVGEHGKAAVHLVERRGSATEIALGAGETIAYLRFVEDKREQEGDTYGDAEVAELRELGQAGKEFFLGDTVQVKDAEMGIDSSQRIVLYKYDLIHPMRSRVEFNQRSKRYSADQSIHGQVADTRTTARLAAVAAGSAKETADSAQDYIDQDLSPWRESADDRMGDNAGGVTRLEDAIIDDLMGDPFGGLTTDPYDTAPPVDWHEPEPGKECESRVVSMEKTTDLGGTRNIYRTSLQYRTRDEPTEEVPDPDWGVWQIVYQWVWRRKLTGNFDDIGEFLYEGEIMGMSMYLVCLTDGQPEETAYGMEAMKRLVETGNAPEGVDEDNPFFDNYKENAPMRRFGERSAEDIPYDTLNGHARGEDDGSLNDILTRSF